MQLPTRAEGALGLFQPSGDLADLEGFGEKLAAEIEGPMGVVVGPIIGHQGDVLALAPFAQQRFDKIESFDAGHIEAGENEVGARLLRFTRAIFLGVERTEARVWESQDYISTPEADRLQHLTDQRVFLEYHSSRFHNESILLEFQVNARPPSECRQEGNGGLPTGIRP
jgi:hypothetical protein